MRAAWKVEVYLSQYILRFVPFTTFCAPSSIDVGKLSRRWKRRRRIYFTAPPVKMFRLQVRDEVCYTARATHDTCNITPRVLLARVSRYTRDYGALDRHRSADERAPVSRPCFALELAGQREPSEIAYRPHIHRRISVRGASSHNLFIDTRRYGRAIVARIPRGFVFAIHYFEHQMISRVDLSFY